MPNQTVGNMQVNMSRPKPAPTDPTQIPVPPAEEIHYRVIADQELERLNPLLERLGWARLDPDYCKVVVAEMGEGEGALICGFSVVQFVVHAEPTWVDPNMRGTGVAEQLVEKVQHYIENDCKIKRYVCTAKPGSFAARLCEKYGMRPYPGEVWVRQID